MPNNPTPSVEADAIHLTNSIVSAIISPAKARILFFGRKGGKNLLWVNPDPIDTHNGIHHGGDRVLFSPQSLWPQIRPGGSPDVTAVNTPWRLLKSTPREITLESEPDEYLKVRMRRTITLPENKAELHQFYQLERYEQNPFPVHIWTIAQVPALGTAWMHIASDSPDRNGNLWTDFFRNLKRDESIYYLADRQALRYQWPTSQPSKLGTFGSWVAWHNSEDGLLISAPRKKTGPYYDQSNLQVFALPGPGGFVELETQSTTEALEPHASIEHEVHWRLLNREQIPQDDELANQFSTLAKYT